jgi:hypothetical protein
MIRGGDFAGISTRSNRRYNNDMKPIITFLLLSTGLTNIAAAQLSRLSDAGARADSAVHRPGTLEADAARINFTDAVAPVPALAEVPAVVAAPSTAKGTELRPSAPVHVSAPQTPPTPPSPPRDGNRPPSREKWAQIAAVVLLLLASAAGYWSMLTAFGDVVAAGRTVISAPVDDTGPGSF